MDSKIKTHHSKTLSQKMAMTFFGFVILPGIILSLLSAFFFQKGIHSWFKDRIQSAMNSARIISQQYIQNDITHIDKAANIIAKEIGFLREKDSTLQYAHLSELLNMYGIIGNISSVLFKKNPKESYQVIAPIAFSKNWNKAIPVTISLKTIQEAEEKNTVIFSKAQDSHLVILRHVHDDLFLIVGKKLDPFIVENITNANSSINTYIDDLQQEKRWFWSSVFLFLLFSSLLIGLAFWGSSYFKRDIIQPVNALLWGVKMLRMEKTPFVDIDAIKTSKELLLLMESFNAMAESIQKQKDSLKKINKNLSEKNIFMETVFQSVSSGVLMLSEKGNVLLCNDQAKKLLLFDQMIGQNIGTFHTSFQKMIQQSIKNPDKIHTHTIFSQKNMKSYRVHMRYNQDTQNVIATLDDVGHLIASQKKGAFLDIARRVAHEIRNPLTPIVLSAQRLEQRYKNDVKDRETFISCLDSIVRQSEIIGNIIKEFSYFVRMPLVQFRNVEISSLIAKTIHFQQTAYENISFQADLFEYFIWCDASHIERALTNILKNALEAVEDNTHKPIIKVTMKEQPTFIQIIVKDNGTGLDANHVLSTHEPYSSQKSQGMGLGLSIVEKVATDHGGSFAIYNNVDEPGATTMITLAKNRPAPVS